MAHDMRPFEFDPTTDGQAAEAGMRAIDAICVDFPSTGDVHPTPSPQQAVRLLLQLTLGSYLIELTPEMVVRELLGSGCKREELLYEFLNASCAPQLDVETAIINKWLHAAGVSPVSQTRITEILQAALSHLTTREEITALPTAAVAVAAAQAVVKYVTDGSI